MSEITVTISPEVKALGVYLAYSAVTDIDNSRDASELYTRLIPEIISQIRAKLSLDRLKDEINIRVFRDLYWRLGIDPTKQRPAHEALLRRVLRGEDLPRINPIVDIGNYASVKYMLPVGLYDLDRVESRKIVLRFARKGEKVKLLGSGEKALLQNQIVLAAEDSNKILHVFPHRDSEDTSIKDNTKNVLIVVAGIEPIPKQQALQCVEDIINLLQKLLNGKPTLEPKLV